MHESSSVAAVVTRERLRPGSCAERVHDLVSLFEFRFRARVLSCAAGPGSPQSEEKARGARRRRGFCLVCESHAVPGPGQCNGEGSKW
jgi:hypothetical protein